MAREPRTLEEAADYYSKANDEMQVARITFYEKIALYSGAIISLSITFIGYLISKDPSIFLRVEFGIPLYVFIFFAWGFLATSLFAGIYIRLFHAQRLSRMLHVRWLRFRIETGERFLEEPNEEDWVGFTDDEMTAIDQHTREMIVSYSGIEASSKRVLVIYDFIGPLLRISTVALFMVGCILTLVFVALSTLNSVGGVI